MDERKLRIAITHGDTNGIGYQIIFKTFGEQEMLDLCTPIVYGSPKVAAYYRKLLDANVITPIINSADAAQDGKLNLLTCFENEVKVETGVPTAESAKAGEKALQRALADVREGKVDALVVMPMTGSEWVDQTGKPVSRNQYIKQHAGGDAAISTILVSNRLRMLLATDGIAMSSVAEQLSKEALEAKLTAFHTALKRDFCHSNPRLALLAYNPDGQGKEETEVLQPLIKELQEKGISVFGPYTAATFFGQRQYEAFDGVVALYGDQGLVPMSLLASGEEYTLLTGLPVACTSPMIDNLFAHVGEESVDENPLRQAIYAAIDAARNRVVYDEATKNPLPKLFHERRDDSEKVRFAMPKRREDAAPKE